MDSETTDNVLGQIWMDDKWVDYARGTEAQVRAWVESEPAGKARGVDWIGKTRVIVPPRTQW